MAVESSNTAHLLAELTKNAAEFNRATDSINSLIERFEETLRNLQLGLETWVVNPPLSSEEREVEDDDGTQVDGSVDAELGFTKRAGEWGLAVRTAVYRRVYLEDTDWELLRVESEFPLRDGSRELRIAALEQFPHLLQELNDKVKQITKKIHTARQFVELP